MSNRIFCSPGAYCTSSASASVCPSSSSFPVVAACPRGPGAEGTQDAVWTPATWRSWTLAPRHARRTRQPRHAARASHPNDERGHPLGRQLALSPLSARCFCVQCPPSITPLLLHPFSYSSLLLLPLEHTSHSSGTEFTRAKKAPLQSVSIIACLAPANVTQSSGDFSFSYFPC